MISPMRKHPIVDVRWSVTSCSGGADIPVRLGARYASTRFGSRIRSPRRTGMSAPADVNSPEIDLIAFCSLQHPHSRVAGAFVCERGEIEAALLAAFGPGD